METINWSEFEERAARMTNEQLQNACKAIADALPAADALDRATGQDRGGRYRDESSVYRRELDQRYRRELDQRAKTNAAERFGEAVAKLCSDYLEDDWGSDMLAELQSLYLDYMSRSMPS